VEKFLQKQGVDRRYSELISMGEWLLHMLAYAIFYYFAVFQQNIVSAILLGYVTGRLGFLMHNGNHAGFSHYPWGNKLAGLSMDFVGSSSLVWSMEHQVSHHMEPNEHEKDNDFSIGDPYLRFNKWISHSWWHKWNHILTIAIMPLGTWRWYFSDMAIMLEGSVGSVKFHITKMDLFTVFFWKFAWFLRFFVLPIYLHGFSSLITVVIVQFMSAEIMENIFIVNHIQSDLDPPKNGHWAVRQVHATSNWSSESLFWNWFSGGLNHQIEHHLFPSVSYFLYPKISPIVQQTCKEFDIPYFNFPNYSSAWYGMFHHLKTLGYDERDPARPAPILPRDLTKHVD